MFMMEVLGICRHQVRQLSGEDGEDGDDSGDF